jgi:hypothetical protein
MGYAIVIAAVVAALGTVTNTVLTLLLRRFVQPPSGGTLGEVAERAQHAAEAGAAGMTEIAKRIGPALAPPGSSPSSSSTGRKRVGRGG